VLLVVLTAAQLAGIVVLQWVKDEACEPLGSAALTRKSRPV
jgi:hypothetical protein